MNLGQGIIKIAKSQTFVPVGPVFNKAPNLSKNEYESLCARKDCISSPATFASASRGREAKAPVSFRNSPGGAFGKALHYWLGHFFRQAITVYKLQRVSFQALAAASSLSVSPFPDLAQETVTSMKKSQKQKILQMLNFLIIR